jgi:RHS repeat-associated protein
MGFINDTNSAVKLISSQLDAFTKLDNFWNLFEIAFGKEYDQAAALRLWSQWQAGDFSQFPDVEVISSSILGDANGAYAISTNKIYLSDAYVNGATTEALVSTLLEEYGHFVDAQVNQVDSKGDEGAIFAALVLGQSLDADTLLALRSEDDHAVIEIDGVEIAIEQQNFTGTAGNDTITGTAGDDTINAGLGIDTVDGGLGNDLLMVDYSSNNYAGSSNWSAGITSFINSNGLSGNFRAYIANSVSSYDRVTFSNIERFDITGTSANDNITTGGGNDIISGGGGDDTLDGGLGNDTINGGLGNDIIDNNKGIDTIDGGEGLDTLVNASFTSATQGLSFDDTGTTHAPITLSDSTSITNIEYFTNLTTGSGNDTITFTQRIDNNINTGSGDDTINAGLGDDTVDGGLGNDLLIVDYSSNNYAGVSNLPAGITTSNISSNGSSGFFRAYTTNSFSSYDRITFSNIERFDITGTSANDNIKTGTGNDIINGGAGDDTIDGGLGNDTINGGLGNDSIDNNKGIDTIDGGEGLDTLVNASFTSATQGLSFDDTGTAHAPITLSDGTSISNIEYFTNLTTGSGNDTITFTQRIDNGIVTGNGDDTINAGLGFDTVDGGLGNDLLIVDYSSNTYAGVSNLPAGITSSINGSSGVFLAYTTNSFSSYDRIAFSNIERFDITGTSANDNIKTGIGNDIINGGAGDDTLNGAAGNDVINGGLGDDIIDNHTGIDTIDGGEGSDTLVNANFASVTQALSFDDTGITHAPINLSDGTSITNIEYFTNLTTGSGNDTITFTQRIDNNINTGSGDDTINAGLGDDNVDGGLGNDLLIVDYSSNTYAGITTSIFSNGLSGNFRAYTTNSFFSYDRIIFSNIERFQITGTGANDKITTGAGNDIINGSAGADILNGATGNDTYILDAIKAAGSSIQDSAGNDTLILQNAQIDVAKAQSGKLGLGRLNTTLIADLNQDGVLNPSTDLSILDFYSDRFSNTAGKGFIETIGNISGSSVLGLKILDKDIVDLGTLNSLKTINDSVNSTNNQDFYIFNLDSDSQVNLSLNNNNLAMQLLYATSGNQNVIANGQSIQKNLFAGTYIVSLSSFQTNNYTLQASANPIVDQAGNTIGNARNLGTIVGSQTFKDFVGDVDPVDFYRFELSKPSTYNYSISNNVSLSLLDKQGNLIANPPAQLAAGTYYLKVNSLGINANYSMTLNPIPSATPVPLQIQAVTPNIGSNGGTTTITVEGTQFTADTKLTLIAPDGTTRPASQVIWYDNTTLSGTFDLKGLSTGLYDVRVESAATTVTSNDIFTINSQLVNNNTLFNNDNIELSLVVPSGVRPWWTGEVTVNYRNTGSSDIIAPLLTLSTDKAKMRLDGDQEFTATSLQFLAGGSDAVTGILSPGETGSFTALFLPNPTNSNVNINFAVDKAKLYNLGENAANQTVTTFDWQSIKPTLKPETIPDAAWNIIWTNFTNSVGTEVSQYQSVLAENATYLSQIGEPTNDVSRLLSFELLQANNFGVISQRYTDSVLGKGQLFPWDITFTTDVNGNITVKQAESNRNFNLQPNGSYLAETGDNGVLSLVGGIYRLQEKDGSQTVFRADGKFDYIEDVNSNRIQSTYTNNQLTKLAYSNGDNINFTYNAQGRINKATDQAGRVTTYGYDATGDRLINITTPDGTTTYSYVTAAGASQFAISSITYPDGSQVLYQYDNQGRLTRQSLNGGTEAINYSYDSTGGVTITDASGAVTKQFLNDRGQIARAIDPLNRTVQYRYDSEGNLTQIVAPSDTASSFIYDAQGNLLSSINPLGHRVDFSYEPNFDQLASVQDQKGNLTNYAYDAKGNLTKLTYADGSTETFGYNSQGNLTVSANRRGQAIQYTYDANFQLIRKDYAGGSSATFSYDSRGNLLTAIDADSSTSFVYDSADRLTKVTDGDGRFVSYAYDAAGRRTQMADNLGNVVNYSYDTVGRLSNLKNGTNSLIASYAYDSIGNLSRSDNGNGTYTTYSYDKAGQQLSLVNYKADNTVNSRFDYAYDALGRRTSMTTLEGKTNYGYDATGQLTSVSLPNGRTIEYQYDAAGNRTKVTDSGVATNYGTNILNQYTTVGGATYTYDTDGNLTKKVEGGQTSSYVYDVENRLIGVTTSAGTWSYEYDALGNRIASVKDGQRTEFLLDPTGLGNVVGEYDSNGNLIANYTYGLGLESRSGSGNQAYYDFDAIGSVAGLTSAAGSYVNQYSYLPFGENLTTTESIANPFEYVGQWGVMDEGNGLDFMRARFYNASTGKFLSTDPIGIAAGDTNLYRYTFNNPVSYNDPSGLIVPFIIFGTGFAIGWITGNLAINAHYDRNDFNELPSSYYNDDVLKENGWIPLPAWQSVEHQHGEGNEKNTKWVKPDKYGFGSSEVVFTPDRRIVTDSLNMGTYNYFDVNSLWGVGIIPHGLFDWLPYKILGNTRAPNIPNLPIANAPVPVVVSRDPNDIVGPKGFGAEGWLIPNQALPYMIRFENASDAGASAVFVTVTQQLDSDFDWTTFQLGDFGFGDFYIDVPDGFQNYSTRVDARESIGYFVDFEASLNATTGKVTYKLTTIDPVTGKLPTNFDAGFLPPNDKATNSGEGFLKYKIQAKPNLATGIQLTTEASIVFDTNDPINTPVHLNTVDNTRPSSAVTALPSTTRNTSFNVAWTGNDGGSGIASYDIYVSTNGGQPVLWKDDTTDTSAIYNGQTETTYSFYSVATDNVGQTEAAPTQADTTILVGATAKLSGLAYLDANNNGLIDAGETKLAGVTITLTGNANNGTTENRTITTATDGTYEFNNLWSGSYTLTETQPTSYNDGLDSAGSLSGTLGNDVISNITVGAGATGTGYNFGEQTKPASPTLVKTITNQQASIGGDTLTGTSGRDKLIGGAGNDILIGLGDRDQLVGGAGSDIFRYEALTDSLYTNTNINLLDNITDFNQAEGDRIQIVPFSPSNLFNVGTVNAANLQEAIQSVYSDRDPLTSGNQALNANEAAFFKFGARSYLSVNDSTAGFSNSTDLVVDVTNMKFKAGDDLVGQLNAANYFV